MAGITDPVTGFIDLTKVKPLKPEDLINNLAQSAEMATAANRRVADEVRAANVQMQSVNDGLLRVINDKTKVIESQSQDVNHALNNLARISSIPGKPGALISGVLGLFDSDWNKEYQQRKIQQAGVIIDQEERQIRQAETTRNIFADAANRRVQEAETQAAVAAKDVNSQYTLLNAQATAQQVSRAQQMADAELMTEDQLIAAKKDGKNWTGVMEKELTNKLIANYELQRASSLAQRGQIEAAATARGNALDNISEGVLRAMLGQAETQNTGSYSMKLDNGNAIKFNAQELTTALQQRVEAKAKIVEADNKMFTSIEGIDATSRMVQANAAGIAKANGGYAPPEIAGAVTRADAVARKALEEGNYVQAKKAFDETYKFVTEKIDEYSKNMPKEQEGSYKHYVTNGGQFTSQALAAGHTAANLMSGAVDLSLSGNQLFFLTNTSRSLAANFEKVRNSSPALKTMTPEQLISALSGGNKNVQDSFRKALTMPAVDAQDLILKNKITGKDMTVQEQLIADALTDYTQKTIQALHYRLEEVQTPEGVKTKPVLKDDWKDNNGNPALLDKNGNIRQDYLANGSVDIQVMLAKIRQNDLEIKNTGAPDLNRFQAVIDELQNPAIIQNYASGVNAMANIDQAAIMKTVIGNDLNLQLRGAMMQTLANTNMIDKVAQEMMKQQKLQQDQLNSTLGLFVPGLGPQAN